MISRLANPTKLWNTVPVNRRAAVLAILYPDLSGHVSCLLTTRSGHISYAGDAAFPGGKADFDEETSLQTARREAYEEIGLPLDLKLKPVRTMPAYLSSKFLCVVPEVVWLEDVELNPISALPTIIDPTNASHEVNKIFNVPLARFLDSRSYHTKQANWSGMPYSQHFFSIPAREKKIGEPANILVWGLTANILIDIARLWFHKEPEFLYRKEGQYGDQELIEKLQELGYFGEQRPDFINFKKVLGKNSPLLSSRLAC